MKRIGRLGLTILYTGGGGGIVTKSCQTLATPWTVACQAPLSVGFSRQAYWSGLPFPSPGDLPNPGIGPSSPALWADSLPTEPQGKPSGQYNKVKWNSHAAEIRVRTRNSGIDYNQKPNGGSSWIPENSVGRRFGVDQHSFTSSIGTGENRTKEERAGHLKKIQK